MSAYRHLTATKMVAMHPKQGMFPGIFTHSVHVRSSRKFQGLTFSGMRIYVPSCSTNGQADEEIQQVPESAKTPKTANTFWILLMRAFNHLCSHAERTPPARQRSQMRRTIHPADRQ